MSSAEPPLRAEPIRELGKTAIRKGLPEIGKGLFRLAGNLIKAHPVGGVLDDIGVLDGLGKALGVESREPEVLHRKLESMSPAQVTATIRLEELNAEVAIANLQAETAALQSDTDRIAAVNETIRAEVLSNPCSGAWRPMWGRWSCAGFWISIGTVLLMTFVDLIAFEGLRLIPHLPMVLGALLGVFALPGAILGVASYHRGVEKRVLAGEGRETITVKD